MSAFSHGFNHGFNFGMFNNMFGGAWCNPFGNPFNGCGFNSFYNFGHCCNNSIFWNPSSMFMIPRYNFNNFIPYQTNATFMPTNFNVNIPSFITAPNWNDINYTKIDFSAQNFNTGDTFVRSSGTSSTDNSKSTSTISSSSKNSSRTTTPASDKCSSTTSTPASSKGSSSKAKHWTKMTDAEMYDVYGGYSKDVTVLYKGTADDLNKYLKGKGKLEGKGEAFIKAQNKYGISAAILVGIAMHESGGGTSRLARQQNNIGGVRYQGSYKFRSFSSVEACIDYMGDFLSKGYINNSTRPLTKLYQINAKYCPATDPTDKSGGNSKWARAIDKYSTEVERALA